MSEHRMKTAIPCPIDPDRGHLMADHGYSAQHCARISACACGVSRLGTTDEHLARHADAKG